MTDVEGTLKVGFVDGLGADSVLAWEPAGARVWADSGATAAGAMPPAWSPRWAAR